MNKSVGFYSKHHIKPSGTTQLRCLQPVDYLKSYNWVARSETIYRSLPRKGEITILHRATLDNYTSKFIKYARALGNLIYYDIDDLLFDHAASHHLITLGKKKVNRSKEYLQAMIQCDGVISSTEFLANEARKHVEKVEVLRNALDENYVAKADKVRDLRGKEVNKEMVTMCYLSGSKSHDWDFKVIEETLIDLLKVHENLKLLIVGDLNYSSEFLGFGSRFTHSDFVPYEDYPLLFNAIDINLIPLETERPFCHAKSELKYIEAGICGIPSIASPTETYKSVIKDGYNGFLADKEGWRGKLEELITNQGMRLSMGERSYQDACNEYVPSIRALEWHDFIKGLIPASSQKDTKTSQYSKYLQLELLRSKRSLSRVIRG